MVNTMLHKGLQIHLNNTYLALTDKEQDYISPVNIDIMNAYFQKNITAPYQEAYTLLKKVTIVP